MFKEPVSEQLTSEQRETSEKEKSDVVWGFSSFPQELHRSLKPRRQLLARPARAPLSQAPQHFSALLWSWAGD